LGLKQLLLSSALTTTTDSSRTWPEASKSSHAQATAATAYICIIWRIRLSSTTPVPILNATGIELNELMVAGVHNEIKG